MKLVLAIALVALIAFLGSRLVFLERRLPLGFLHIILTGTEYIFIGVLLGGMGLDLLDTSTLHMLEPVTHFGLGWVGFLFGLQFSVKQIRTLPRYYFLVTMAQAGVTFVVVTTTMYYALGLFLSLSGPLLVAAALTLGSTACCTAQSALAVVAKGYNFPHRQPVDLLRYTSSVDGLFGLLFFAMALSFLPFKHPDGFAWGQSLRWIATTVAMGVVPALVFVSLLQLRFKRQEFLLFIVGVVMFCSGLAVDIHGSPLVSGMICGLLVANWSRHRLRALSVVIHSEKSVYIMLLLLFGASWNLHFDFSLIIMVAYFCLRLLGKVVGTFAGTQVLLPRQHMPAHLGVALIPEGAFAIALIFSFKLVTTDPVVDVLFTVVILSVVISELIGPRLLTTVLGAEPKKEAP